jgi:hypothetical protein
MKNITVAVIQKLWSLGRFHQNHIAHLILILSNIHIVFGVPHVDLSTLHAYFWYSSKQALKYRLFPFLKSAKKPRNPFAILEFENEAFETRFCCVRSEVVGDLAMSATLLQLINCLGWCSIFESPGPVSSEKATQMKSEAISYSFRSYNFVLAIWLYWPRSLFKRDVLIPPHASQNYS